jgi:O-succinylbenzoate synthase
VEWAQRRNADPVISASYESGVGLRMLVALAAAYSDVPAGLSTYTRLADDVLRPRLSLDGAWVEVAPLDQSSVERRLLDVLTPRP